MGLRGFGNLTSDFVPGSRVGCWGYRSLPASEDYANKIACVPQASRSAIGGSLLFWVLWPMRGLGEEIGNMLSFDSVLVLVE